MERLRPNRLSPLLAVRHQFGSQWTRRSFTSIRNTSPSLRWSAAPHSRLRPAQPALQGRAYAESKPDVLKRTPLYDLHVEHAGKMVPFAGFSMPVQYGDLSIGDSHRWTREKASLFDVGHMVQHRISGPGAASLLERITPASVTSLQSHNSTLSCLLHPVTGGIVDDMVITRLGPETFYLVTNAGCREKDTAYLARHIRDWNEAKPGTHLTTSSTISPGSESISVNWEVLDGWGLVALQGPLSASILSSLLPNTDDENDLSTLYFSQSRLLTLNLPLDTIEPTPPILVSRAGYTGEDGFELSIPPHLTSPVTNALLAQGTPSQIRLAGLGARDSLRLEAGMCLYGHDLDDSTTPVEASLAWLVPKTRRSPETAGFHGAEAIVPQITPAKDGGTGVTRRRVGLLVEDGSPAREGAEIITPNPAAGDEQKEQVIGHVTSGCPSPTLGKNIAMGYVGQGWWKVGTEVAVRVRGKKRSATVVKMPFVPSKFWKGTGTAPA
ncbi:MAG: Aminomethyltransferase, mitochondrial [Sclerophora amabilis]|nr:MAG: Aminomethyltransferase, mitochondrial [Sclerophora amabilis]